MDTGLRPDSHYLGDFLRIKDEDLRTATTTSTRSGRRNSLAGLTLSAVLNDNRIPDRTAEEPLPPAQSNRTLLDVLRDEHLASQSIETEGQKSWRQIKQKLRLRRLGAISGSGSTWTRPTAPVNNSSTSSSNNFTQFPDSTESTHPSTSTSRLDRVDSLATRRVQSEEVVENHPVRMSLMALLAQTDRQMGIDRSNRIDVIDDDEEEDFVDDEIAGKDFNNCCVCMVRHKGSAFIPCGHTFCRLCSRELLAQRGNCPLCNNYIVEILDIF